MDSIGEIIEIADETPAARMEKRPRIELPSVPPAVEANILAFIAGPDPDSPEEAHSVPYRVQLESYRTTIKRHALTVNPLRYWSEEEKSTPNTGALASVVLSLPVTQVSVERVFSCLPIIITDRRNRLSARTVNNLLVVKYGTKNQSTI